MKLETIEVLGDKSNFKAEANRCYKNAAEYICDAIEYLYEVLPMKELDASEKDKMVEVCASLKGAKMAIDEALEKYSGVDSKTEKAIKKGADEFLKGLGETAPAEEE